jgi:predicted nucleic acid-binding protein
VGALALDASVAIGLLDTADVHHERARAALSENRTASLLMAASAYSETLVRPLASGNGEAVENFVEILRVEIVPADRDIGRRAAEIRARRRSLRLPDALVLATAQMRQAPLLSFDVRVTRVARELGLGEAQS